MSIEDLGNLGDFVGGIAVVITLIYLSIQVKRNTRSNQAQALASWASFSGTTNSPIIADKEFSRLLVTLQDDDEIDFLSPDGLRINIWLVQALINWQVIFYLAETDTVDTEFLETQTLMMKQVLNSPGGSAWWDSTGRQQFTAKFVQFVDRRIT